MADDAEQDKSTDLTTDLTTELTPGPTKPGRGRWILLTVLSLSFLGVSVVLLGMAVNQRQSVQTASVAATGESPGEDTSTGRPITTAMQEPEELSVPFEWSPDGLALLPFGAEQDDAIGAMTQALGPPDEVAEVAVSECTPGTNARWKGGDVQLRFDESGRLAAVILPTEMSRTGTGPIETLGDLRTTFSALDLEYVAPNPEWGYDDPSYTWSVTGQEAKASGSIPGDTSDTPIDGVWLDSERFDDVECFE